MSLRLPDAAADEGSCEMIKAIVPLPLEVQQRLEVIQQVMAVRGTEHSAKVQRQEAKTLGLSVRSWRRLMLSWQDQGIAGSRPCSGIRCRGLSKAHYWLANAPPPNRETASEAIAGLAWRSIVNDDS